jgi:hypothetical protein
MVFTDEDFCSDYRFTDDTTPWIPSRNMREIEALQAAYMVCLYQNWEGTDASKRRIRRYRFSTVVSVICTLPEIRVGIDTCYRWHEILASCLPDMRTTVW